MHRPINFPPLRYRFAALALGGLLFSMGVVGCGSKDNGGTACDINTLMSPSKYNCAGTGCHSGSAPAANLSLAGTDLASVLVNKMPAGGGPTGQTSLCSGMGLTYLVGGSNPATGLFLQKLDPSPPCGVQMPQIGNKVTSADRACFQTFANSLTGTNGGG